jgi:hypothetical protein
LFDRLTHVTATPVAAALVAVLAASAPAGAQTTIELPAENATVRGKWVVTSDATAPGGGKTMRHPDAGAAKTQRLAHGRLDLDRRTRHAPRATATWSRRARVSRKR